MKKIIIITLLLEYVCPFDSGISVCIDLLGKHKAANIKLDDYDLGDLNSDVNVGISLRLTSIPNLTKTTSFGMGVEYQTGRDTDDFNGDFSFNSFWFTVYQIFDQQLYGLAQLGYGTFKADNAYQGDGSAALLGGPYYGIGLGYVLNEKLNIEGVYCTNLGSYYNYISFVGANTYDVRYDRLNISIIYILNGN